MVTIDYSIKLKTKEERYLFIQTVFYLVCKKIVENYRQITKEDLLKKDRIGEKTKFKTVYMGRYDGKICLIELFRLLNPYAVSGLLSLYISIDRNWNRINNRRDWELTREIYLGRCLNFLRSRLNYSKQEKQQVDLFFKNYTNILFKYQKSKFFDMKLPLYIQTYNEDEINEVIFFLKNISLIFSIDPFMVKLLEKNYQKNDTKI